MYFVSIEYFFVMDCLYCLLVILVLTNQTDSVKVNVEGTVSLGKDVMDSLSQFLGNIYVSGRRSMLPVADEDPITGIVRTAVLCRNLDFCARLTKFVKEFLTVLAMSIQTVLREMLHENFKEIVFEEQIKHYLEIVRNILERANSKVVEETEMYYWIDSIKKICARFQEMASIFVSEELQIDPKEVNNVKEELNQKLIIATVLVEMKYQTKLCIEYNFCIIQYKVTKSLHTLLERLRTTSEEKVRLFIRYFYEALFDTDFYNHVNEKTAHELQVILNDMAYSHDVPTKEVLQAVEKIVEARLVAIENNKDDNLSHDSLLVQVILSDMDHIYSVHKTDPFNKFFQHFYDWLVDDIKINKDILRIVKDIGTEIKNVSDDILIKLISEVRVFLEITVNT